MIRISFLEMNRPDHWIPNRQQKLCPFLQRLIKKGQPIMIVTHDVKVAAKTERILFMVDGNIVAQKKMSKYDAAT